MSLNHHLPQKIDLTPKRHHGFQVVLFIFGMLLPPLAVAARFGIGKDFFINCILTICGYIPGHGHNFYIQNIRNNSNKARTPKWAIRYGLVSRSEIDRRAKKSQWAKRYDERNNESTLVGADLADGEEGTNYDPRPKDTRRTNEGLWTNEDELYYNDENEAPNQRNWHYPANFEGTIGDGRSKRKPAAQASGNRFERARRAQSNDSYGTYPPRAHTDDDVPEWGRDYGSKGRRSSRSSRSSGSGGRGDSGYEASGSSARKQGASGNSDDVFSHQF